LAIAARPPFQGVICTLVEAADSFVVESRLIDHEIGADKKSGGQLLDRKTNRIRGSVKPLVAKGTQPGFPRFGGETLSLRTVVEFTHTTNPVFRLLPQPLLIASVLLLPWTALCSKTTLRAPAPKTRARAGATSPRVLSLPSSTSPKKDDHRAVRTRLEHG